MRQRLVCTGCGHRVALEEARPFRCPNRRPGDGMDHLLALRVVDTEAAEIDVENPNPFLGYRQQLYSWELALSRGMTDTDYVELVEELDAKVAEVCDCGLEFTGLFKPEELARSLGFNEEGGIWVKDEASNIVGSHKARHLFGILLFLEVARRTGLDDRPDAELAIASCGNAALAAAALAKAVGRRIFVFIPTTADPKVIAMLGDLDARFVLCDRKAQDPPGDPCLHRFREAVESGMVPFCCQGSENGLCIEGGRTLAWELSQQLRWAGVELDHLFVQVGGGALASACIDGMDPRPRRFHAVQTEGGHPLERSWRRVVAWMQRERGGLDLGAPAHRIAETIEGWHDPDFIGAALNFAATHRPAFMWPWTPAPSSRADGILDDETYDWRRVLEGMLRSGGWPVVATEDRVLEAVTLGRGATGIPVSATGTAGLAGLMQALSEGSIDPGAKVGLLFTGKTR